MLGTKVPFVSRKDSRFTAAAQRKSAITVELNFVDPGAHRHGTEKLRFHRLDEARQACGDGGAISQFQSPFWAPLVPRSKTSPPLPFDVLLSPAIEVRFSGPSSG